MCRTLLFSHPLSARWALARRVERGRWVSSNNPEFVPSAVARAVKRGGEGGEGGMNGRGGARRWWNRRSLSADCCTGCSAAHDNTPLAKTLCDISFGKGNLAEALWRMLGGDFFRANAHPRNSVTKVQKHVYSNNTLGKGQLGQISFDTQDHTICRIVVTVGILPQRNGHYLRRSPLSPQIHEERRKAQILSTTYTRLTQTGAS